MIFEYSIFYDNFDPYYLHTKFFISTKFGVNDNLRT